MRKVSKIQHPVMPYLQAIPEILIFKAVSNLILFALAFVLEKLMMWAVYKTGRVAVSSGDFAFLFKSPYGWIAILTGFILCAVYIAFDINVVVNYAGEKVKERPAVLWKILLESLAESALFFTPGGLLVLFYSLIIAPMFGVGMSISLTKDLYLPNFIMEVIKSNIIYNVGYRFFCVLMIVIGVLGIFTIHGMVIDHISPVKAYFRSARTVIRNFWALLNQIVRFIVMYALAALAFTLILLVVPALIILFDPGLTWGFSHLCLILSLLILFLGSLAATSLYLPLLTMKMTQLYYQYSENEPVKLQTRPVESYKRMAITIIVIYLGCWGASVFVQYNFDEIFPPTMQASVIGHRGAGSEGGENTVSGIKKAIDLGCYGAEVDVQRTKDGYYILNHDNTFKRVAGVNKAPSEMTLEEIKALDLNGSSRDKVPTIEEALDASGTDIMLFIELKGNSADTKMCDDIVRMIRERHLEEYCVLISLKYNLVDYIEDRYPDMQTGYLAFITLGNVGALNCDYLGLEEEAATPAVIRAAHENGRKVMVWTPNSSLSQRRFLMSDADAIITDNTSQANIIFDALRDRDEIARMIDTFLYNFI